MLMRRIAHLTLHGHDEDSGRAIADYELIKILGIGDDSIDGGIAASGGLGRSEGACAIAGLGIPYSHCAVTGGSNHLQ